MATHPKKAVPKKAAKKPAPNVKASSALQRVPSSKNKELFAVPPNLGMAAIRHDATYYQRLLSAQGRWVVYNNDEAVRQSRQDSELMLNDLSLMNPLNERLTAAALMSHRIEPEDKADEAQVAMARDVSLIVDKIPKFFQYKKALLNAIWYGRYGVSNTFGPKIYNRKPFWGVADWAPIHGDKFFFDTDGNAGLRVGQFENLRDYSPDQTIEGWVIWLDNYGPNGDWLRDFYVVNNHDILDGPIEDLRQAGQMFGVGARSRVYWAWKHRVLMLGWCLDAWARFGTGVAVYFYTEGGPTGYDQMKTIAEQQTGQAALLLPMPMEKDKQGPSFEFIEMNGQGIDKMMTVIRDYFDANIKQYIIGQSLSSETAPTGLGSGVAKFHADTKENLIRGDALNLQETLTRDLIGPLVRCNRRFFPQWPDCELKFLFDIDAPDIPALLEAAESLYRMGIPFDQDDVRAKAGLQKPKTKPVEDQGNRGELPALDISKMSHKERLQKAAELMLWSDY